MSEFDLDNLKKTWQEQKVPPKYNNADILQMLNKKSRNYVKYILWISAAEFLFFLGLSFYYIIQSEDSNNFLHILEKLGIKKTPQIEGEFEHLYFGLKMISLLVTAFFVFKFYSNYRKINVEANLKKFILQLLRFKKTVNTFIFTNIVLLVVFTTVLTLFVFRILSEQHIQLTHPMLIGFLVGLLISTLLSIGLIWLYYRVVYGIIMRRLGKNLEELQKIDSQE